MEIYNIYSGVQGSRILARGRVGISWHAIGCGRKV